MRRSLLNISALLLVTVTTLMFLLIGQAWQGRSRLPTDGDAATERTGSGVQVRVARVDSTTQLQLASGELVTLAGILAPVPGAPFAEEGKQAARALAEGQTVRVEGIPSAAYLYLPDGQLLQAVLIAGGYARVAPNAPTDTIGESLRLAEFEAQANNLGIWAGQSRIPLPTPNTAAEIACTPLLLPDSIDGVAATEELGNSATVVFVPSRVVQRNNGLVLTENSANDSFGVVIPATLLTDARGLGAELTGRCLAVTGVIERDVSAAGVRIVVQSPQQVVILR